MLSLVALQDQQSSPEFRKAIGRAIQWLQTAKALLPAGEGSNHAIIHQRLADCYLRKSLPLQMDEHFQSAIAVFEKIGAFDLAAVCAAAAADGWAFFGNKQRLSEYAKSAAYYLSQAQDTPNSRLALQILNQLNLP